ncbi:MAG: hypothetical protein U0R77_05865 [Mycolicibacterium insubricum]|nr:hypothetical protein [Mycobacterium sp.]
MASAVTAALKPVSEIAKLREGASPDEVLAAVAHLRQRQVEIDRWADQLVGVAILGGVAPTTAAVVLQMRPATLRARLRSTWAAARGKPMQRDPKRKDGWGLVPAQAPIQGGAA